MNVRKRILTGIGALAFMVLMALNVQLVNSSTLDVAGFGSLSLVELAAQAQGEGGTGCNCEDWEYCAGGICYPDDNSNNGTIDYMQCPDGSWGGVCGGTGGGCSGC